MVSKVNGTLPAEELPRLSGQGGKRYGAARFVLDVSKPGKVSLKLSGKLANLDLFVDEDVAYAQALLAAGVPAELHVYPGAFHGSATAIPDAEISRRWRADETDALRRALGV